MAYNRLYFMYPTYCIVLTGRTNYITPPIYLDDVDYECYLWHWKICEQSEEIIRVFLSGIIYQYLLSGDGIALPVYSINDRHDAYIFYKLRVLFR